jgi:phenylalanyl-tRNA synthetase beta chain
MLIQEIAGGEISSEVVDVYPRVIQPAEVSISVQKIQSLIGKKIERSVIEKILQALEMTILQSDEAGYLLQIPTYRVDVQRNVDVIEDILRIYGYNNVEIGHNLSYAVSHVDDSKNQRLQQLISEQLTAQGFFEIMNNSLTKGAYYRKLSTYPENKSVKIINSLSNDLNVMRQTLLFGGLESIAYNVNRQHADLKLYEFGNCYRYDYDKKASDENADDDLLSSYREEFHLGIWITGQKHALSWTQTTQNVSVYDLKAYVEGILKRMGVNFSKLVYAPCENDIFSEAITIKTLSDRSLATYGIVHGTLLKATDLEQPVYFADLPWENILKEVKRHRILFNDMPKFPEVRRDLALLLDKNISFETIEKIAFKTERKLLKRVNLFDVYEGKNLDPGKKSYAVSFYIQDAAKTLTDTEIDGVMKKLIKNFEQELGAKLR